MTAFDNSISGTQLVDMIDLINQAEKNGIGIFDLKYHSFVRPIAGAYITLEKNTKLSLTKTNIIEGLKAFEIGNCKYCNAPYIIGKICKNEIKGIDYLLQNKEVDIYENYGDNANARIDYFLLDNRINDEEVDCNILEEYRVCSKCGAIHAANNLVAHRCECGSEYSVTIYKVLSNKDSDDSFLFNNVSQCPCCGHSGKSGVVKSLNVGKDEGTALIAQMLLEAMDDGEETVPVKRKLSLSENKVNESVKKTTNVKQFLAFSDSRQQASFAAMFLEANYTRMIRKRLIWDVIEKNNYHDITFDELTSQLTTAINERDLFTNDLSAQKNAWLTALIDLLKVDGAYDGEGLGLYYFDLDLKDILDSIEEDDVSEVFGKYNLTKSDLATMIQIVFNVFKVTPAIDYTKSTLTDEEKKQFLDYRRFNNYIMFQKQKAVRTYNSKKADQNIRSFLPVNGKSNMVVRYVQKVCVCDEESAKYVLNIIFNNIAVAGALLKRHSTKEIYQIYASKYILKNYKKSKYYICSKCGRLTPYNIHGKCIQDGCEGVLKEVDPDEILAFNYYRRQYMTKKIEKIVVKEHTAQLKREEARQYQLDFKNKNINILSCSTTFEMGIDIGSLETVFMRNVPPTPANYVQRAGRAGRRRDSSAYILTYCGTGSHDYTYFCEPEKMIAGVIKPPYFNVLNHKIIVRHLMAICLGYFFRNNPEYFQNVGFLVFENGFEKFKTYMLSHPKDLNSYINEKVFPENIYKRYHDFQWFDEIDGDDEKINNFVETMKGIVVEYNNARQEALEEEDYKDAERWSREIEKIYDGRVIDSLSKYCVIPKYGFPVDVVELKIYNNGIFENSYDLNRDLRVAISEYAPDSEVIVDGKKYTSKYITLPKKGEFTRNYFCTCHNCRKVNVYISTKTENECKYCGEHISLVDTEFYIEPKYGFKTGITKESTRMKPKRSYAGEVSYLGGGIKDEKKVEIGNVIYIESSYNDELLVMNKSVFYMCPKCGYSQISFGDDRRPSLSVKHKNVGQYDCKNDVLEKIKLGHRFKTDVTRFIIPTLESNEKDSYSKALSFMYAFIEGISNLLYIERNDIDGVLEMNLDNHSYDILVYDNVPGGAGHVKRLLNEDAVVESLRAAFAKVSQHCCDENTSCYNCLRNYYNQSYHSKIKRGYAKEFIELLLKSLGK